jgi:hypothetical protein
VVSDELLIDDAAAVGVEVAVDHELTHVVPVRVRVEPIAVAVRLDQGQEFGGLDEAKTARSFG